MDAMNDNVAMVPRLALRPREAAQALGVSERTIADLLTDAGNGFPCVRIGRAVLIPVRELGEWLARRSTEGALT